jgi:hypothetical protein
MLIKIASLLFVFFISSVPAHSAGFNISSGDVAGLIAAINTANSNGEENAINLGPGTYSLTSVDNSPSTFGGNGLPIITGTMIINGQSAETTTIERNSGAPRFGIFQVESGGNLSLDRITIRGGNVFGPGGAGGISNGGILTITESVIDNNVNDGMGGGGIRNTGTLTILQSFITNNLGFFDAGGILSTGTATITNSTIAHNRSEGAGGVNNGLFASPGPMLPDATMTITNSTISNNQGDGSGGIANFGTMRIANSSIASNLNRFDDAPGGIGNFFLSGGLIITNSTIAGNVAGLGFRAVLSGIGNFSGPIVLRNTIVDQCSGPSVRAITSEGNNVIADLTDCGINLRSSDLTGDPGLAAFIDDGTPGGGRFPLLADSQAINAGNESACPPTDQLETPRNGPCDIGAVEFYPVLNDLVVLANVSTAFDATPVPSGPAGTFRITAEFINMSTLPIGHRFAEVAEITAGNLLLNADGGAGGVGARVTFPGIASRPLLPGATETFEFVIGLQKQEPFTFLVSLLGELQPSNSVVALLRNAQASNP